MTLTIAKTYHFSASHILHGLPDGHPCGRLHGHNYTATIEITGTPDALGFVLDYNHLDATIGQWIADTLDHRHLNDLDHLEGSNPTAEHLVTVIRQQAQQLLPGHAVTGVTVCETPKTSARWTR